MYGDPHARPSTKDQRRDARAALEAPVSLTIDAAKVEGVADNLSAAGILFFTDQDLSCTVEVRSFRGKLVRVQHMSDESTGLAVEFDPEP